MSDNENDTVEVFTEIVGAEPAAASAPSAREDGPRIRWAGIIWGLAFAGIGILALRMLLTAPGRETIWAWTVGLTAPSVVACLLLVIGALLLITGLVGLARRLQRR